MPAAARMGRGRSWSHQEDLELCRAWAAALAGGQSELNSRIRVLFRQASPPDAASDRWGNRSEKALEKRLKLIRPCITRFCKHIAEATAELAPHSTHPLDNSAVKARAFDLYAAARHEDKTKTAQDPENKFKFESCWKIMIGTQHYADMCRPGNAPHSYPQDHSQQQQQQQQHSQHHDHQVHHQNHYGQHQNHHARSTFETHHHNPIDHATALGHDQHNYQQSRHPHNAHHALLPAQEPNNRLVGTNVTNPSLKTHTNASTITANPSSSAKASATHSTTALVQDTQNGSRYHAQQPGSLDGASHHGKSELDLSTSSRGPNASVVTPPVQFRANGDFHARYSTGPNRYDPRHALADENGTRPSQGAANGPASARGLTASHAPIAGESSPLTMGASSPASSAVHPGPPPPPQHPPADATALGRAHHSARTPAEGPTDSLFPSAAAVAAAAAAVASRPASGASQVDRAGRATSATRSPPSGDGTRTAALRRQASQQHLAPSLYGSHEPGHVQSSSVAQHAHTAAASVHTLFDQGTAHRKTSQPLGANVSSLASVAGTAHQNDNITTNSSHAPLSRIGNALALGSGNPGAIVDEDNDDSDADGNTGDNSNKQEARATQARNETTAQDIGMVLPVVDGTGRNSRASSARPTSSNGVSNDRAYANTAGPSRAGAPAQRSTESRRKGSIVDHATASRPFPSLLTKRSEQAAVAAARAQGGSSPPSSPSADPGYPHASSRSKKRPRAATTNAAYQAAAEADAKGFPQDVHAPLVKPSSTSHHVPHPGSLLHAHTQPGTAAAKGGSRNLAALAPHTLRRIGGDPVPALGRTVSADKSTSQDQRYAAARGSSGSGVGGLIAGVASLVNQHLQTGCAGADASGDTTGRGCVGTSGDGNATAPLEVKLSSGVPADAVERMLEIGERLARVGEDMCAISLFSRHEASPERRKSFFDALEDHYLDVIKRRRKSGPSGDGGDGAA